MKVEQIVTLKITEEVPDEFVKRTYSDEEFCESLKSFIKLGLSERGQVEILEDFVQVVHCEHCKYHSVTRYATAGVVLCRKYEIYCYKTDFCAWGERDGEAE